jgi:hypothetical protein
VTDDIKWALTEFASRRNSYTLARNYYDGNHRLAFASEKLQSAFGRLFKAFADNLCPCVCETVKDRLKLDGFTVPQGQDVRPSIDEIWRRNRLKVRANEVHLDSLIEGDGYLIIWPDKEDFPTFYPNRATAIVTEYDDEQPGYITRAAKAWTVENKSRLTLYFRDRIEKYITREKVHGGLPDRAEAFIRFEAEGEPWPIKNNYDKVPVFHFGNRTGIGSLGISELQEAIPVQDALNKSIADMLVASEFYGVPQRWAIGLEDDLTLAEAKKKYPLLAGGVWGSTSKDIKFGQFEPSDVSHYLSIIDGFRKEIARVSRTPLHFFSLEGTYPSGESLKTAEAPLTAKINDKSEAWGGVWSDAMRFALQIAGKGEYEPEAKWLNTETRNEGEQIKQASTKVKDLGIPQEVVWSELGYSEKQIQDMQNAVQSEESEPKEEERTNGQSEVIA